ncbi:hypothetical protein BN159_8097 [Streptomyces davaonensis JCM 4913]|uniref:DUF2180 family protein n=1 Tax=Streptomyces davaonensis (strain DSM 101723 / JCM 4913 / KCC S-0913 / 768) TaxID=1214101 RepID=K4RFS0_STRDJ|nr:DUF2180 family protein [Streptomyces davaonensis]CCK32475.1 hypothetical protein BN159_8097 [Streptomyces davaonensis JCM 4913]
MHCYECALEDTATPAIAVCMRCGCAVCLKHAKVAERLVHHDAGLGQTYGPRPARRVTCPTCHDAEAFEVRHAG